MKRWFRWKLDEPRGQRSTSNPSVSVNCLLQAAPFHDYKHIKQRICLNLRDWTVTRLSFFSFVLVLGIHERGNGKIQGSFVMPMRRHSIPHDAEDVVISSNCLLGLDTCSGWLEGWMSFGLEFFLRTRSGILYLECKESSRRRQTSPSTQK